MNFLNNPHADGKMICKILIILCIFALNREAGENSVDPNFLTYILFIQLKKGGFPLQKTLKYLDPSSNADLDFWDCLGSESPIL